MPGTFGPFWVSYGAFQTFYAARKLGSATSLFLAVFAAAAFYLAIASLRTDLVNAMVLWLAFASLVLLSIGAGTRIGNLTKEGATAPSRFLLTLATAPSSGLHC